jgi:hypothetical protein
MKAYRTILTNDKYSSLRWIANVLTTSSSKPAKKLAALIKLIDDGKDIRPIEFVMPYEGIRIDGIAVCTTPALDRGESIPYSSDWYKH